jgi:hypothetical protein
MLTLLCQSVGRELTNLSSEANQQTGTRELTDLSSEANQQTGTREITDLSSEANEQTETREIPNELVTLVPVCWLASDLRSVVNYLLSVC